MRPSEGLRNVVIGVLALLTALAIGLSITAALEEEDEPSPPAATTTAPG